jgi:hypothetical protein
MFFAGMGTADKGEESGVVVRSSALPRRTITEWR